MVKRTLLSAALALCLVLGLTGIVGAQAVTYPDVSPSYWEGRGRALVMGLDGVRTGDRIGYAAMAIMYQAFDDSFVIYYDEMGPSYGPGAVMLLWEGRNGPYDDDGDCVYPPDYMYAFIGTLGHDESRRLYMNLLGVGGSLDWTIPADPVVDSWGYAISHGMLRWNRQAEEYTLYRSQLYSSLNVPGRPHVFFNGRANLSRLTVVPNGPWFPPWWDWVLLFLNELPEGIWGDLFGAEEQIM